jgi:HSP20 family protein
MTITRYARRSPFLSPWLEVEDMTNRLNRIFTDPSRTRGANGSSWNPTVNVEETTDELLLTAEFPGMGIDDIEIEVENSVLTLKGEKSEERQEGDDRRFHLWERRFGTFKRTFSLPRTVKTEAISARMKDGVLFIQVPKAPEAKSRKISIEAEN